MIVGSKVVCIDDTFRNDVACYYDQLPRKGAHYTIRAMMCGRALPYVRGKDGHIQPGGAGAASGGEVAVLLHELRNGPDPFCSQRELAFKAERFRDLEEEQEQEELEQPRSVVVSVR